MAGTDFGVVNEFYNKLNTAIEGGFGKILGDVEYILNFVLIISVVITALMVWTSEENSNVFKAIAYRIFVMGFSVWLTERWSYIIGIVMQSFFQLGGKAAGVTSDIQTVSNIPAQFMLQGFAKVNQLVDVVNKYSGITSVFTHFIGIEIYSFTIIVIVGALIWMSLEIFIAIIEYKIITLAGFVLVPLNAWQGTAIFGGGILRYVIGAGVKVMTITMVASLCLQVMTAMQVMQEIDIANAVSLAFGAVISALLAHRCGNMAQSVVTGQPVLNAASAIGTMTSAAAGAAGGAGMAVKGAQAASAVAQRARAAYKAATKVGDDRA